MLLQPYYKISAVAKRESEDRYFKLFLTTKMPQFEDRSSFFQSLSFLEILLFILSFFFLHKNTRKVRYFKTLAVAKNEI